LGALLPSGSTVDEWQVSAGAAIHALGLERLELGRKQPIRTVAAMRWNDASNKDNTRPCYSP